MHCRQSTVGVSGECLQQVRSARAMATSCCWQLLLIVDDASRPLPAAADVNTDADSASTSTSRCSTGRGCCSVAILQRFRHGLTARSRDSQVLTDATRPGVHAWDSWRPTETEGSVHSNVFYESVTQCVTWACRQSNVYRPLFIYARVAFRTL